MKPSMRTMGFAALFLGLALAPLAGDYFLGIVAEILIFAIFAMSLGLLIGYTGLMSFGHAAFFGVSSYTVITLGVHLGLSGWLGLVAGVAMSATLAAVRSEERRVGEECVRPCKMRWWPYHYK